METDMARFFARFALVLGVFAAGSGTVFAAESALDKAVADPQRSAEFRSRDTYRHPAAELEFFGIKPGDTVVEIWPSSGYWTEILAPYLHDTGKLYEAGLPSGTGKEGMDKARASFQKKLDADPARYGKVTVTEFGKDHFDIAPTASADLVVTFRNLHNWMPGGYADAAMAGFFKALKPGGILGIEDHRASDAKPQDPGAETGYVRQDYAIELAKKAGFEYVGASEIDANPKDTKDWPKGVWTLPPTFALGDQDHDKYAAIGEADNFVLKFRKPLH
jgi:predicted methyltransferase